MKYYEITRLLLLETNPKRPGEKFIAEWQVTKDTKM